MFFLFARPLLLLDYRAERRFSPHLASLESWGYVLQRGGITFERNKGTLHGGEVYDAEIYGATVAVHAALTARKGDERIFVLLDNQAVVRALKTGITSSSLRITRTFH